MIVLLRKKSVLPGADISKYIFITNKYRKKNHWYILIILQNETAVINVFFVTIIMKKMSLCLISENKSCNLFYFCLNSSALFLWFNSFFHFSTYILLSALGIINRISFANKTLISALGLHSYLKNFAFFIFNLPHLRCFSLSKLLPLWKQMLAFKTIKQADILPLHHTYTYCQV